MSVLAYHHNGDLQYNTHNLYGLSEIKTTAEAVQAIRGKRPFILSRWGQPVACVVIDKHRETLAESPVEQSSTDRID